MRPQVPQVWHSSAILILDSLTLAYRNNQPPPKQSYLLKGWWTSKGPHYSVVSVKLCWNFHIEVIETAFEVPSFNEKINISFNSSWVFSLAWLIWGPQKCFFVDSFSLFPVLMPLFLFKLTEINSSYTLKLKAVGKSSMEDAVQKVWDGNIVLLSWAFST